MQRDITSGTQSSGRSPFTRRNSWVIPKVLIPLTVCCRWHGLHMFQRWRLHMVSLLWALAVQWAFTTENEDGVTRFRLLQLQGFTLNYHWAPRLVLLVQIYRQHPVWSQDIQSMLYWSTWHTDARLLTSKSVDWSTREGKCCQPSSNTQHYRNIWVKTHHWVF